MDVVTWPHVDLQVQQHLIGLLNGVKLKPLDTIQPPNKSSTFWLLKTVTIHMEAVKIFTLLMVYQGSLCSEIKKSFRSCKDGRGSLYDYPLNDIHGSRLPKRSYKNHVTLVMNVATF